MHFYRISPFLCFSISVSYFFVPPFTATQWCKRARINRMRIGGDAYKLSTNKNFLKHSLVEIKEM